MPKTVPPLSVSRINAAKPGEKVVKLTDGGGLALWVMPTGRKVWRIQYRRPHDKKLDTITIGPYPEVGLADARSKRDVIRADLLAGKNPKSSAMAKAEKARHSQVATFRAVATQWNERWRDSVTESYADQVWRVLEANVFPFLGDWPVDQITARMVVDALSPMEARGALVYLQRARHTITQVLAFALARGLVENNVAVGINGAFAQAKPANFRALPPDQLPALVTGLQSDKIETQTYLMITLQLLTMTRPMEAAGMRWDEIDGDMWVIPPERMKRRRQHVIPIVPAVASILERMRPISGHREHVFPGRNDPKTHASEGTANVALKRLGIPTTAHGLRALASTTLHEAGFESAVIEAALAHVDPNKTRAAYNRAEYITQRRQMLEWWAERIKCSSTDPT
ncbi:integrase domain-containing protein [Microvirgula curvata]